MSVKIFSVAMNMHDHNTYDGVVHRQEERYSRNKHNISILNPLDPLPTRNFFLEQFLPRYKNSKNDEIFCFTYSKLGKNAVQDLLEKSLPTVSFSSFKPANLWDHWGLDNLYYIDHHQSHAAYAFLSSGVTESDVLAIDGSGPLFTCIFIDRHGKITNLSDRLSIGGLWNRISQDIGFDYLDAGKTMGLAAFGQFNNQIEQLIYSYLERPINRLSSEEKAIIKSLPKQDVAYTLQKITTRLIVDLIIPLKSSNNICLAGGVAYNGYVNEELTKHYTLVHVPPAVGDEGQAIGTYMHADYILNRNIHVPSAYAGVEHPVDTSIFHGLKYERKPFEQIAKEVAEAIATGSIVGWYQGKSESGNRALGNRSILADPRNPDIKDIINTKIKKREDFRPFAPSVLEEYYQDYFDTNQISPFMSRIVLIKSNLIPGVSHVDNTARIQTVTRNFNQRFYDLINEFYKVTGIPMLLNTSFNCQEPIVETPADAVNTFLNTELDILVINDYIIRK